MSRGLRDWLRTVKESSSEWYGEGKAIWGNFVEWCRDAPVIVVVLLGSTALLFGWLLLVGYFPKPKPVVRGTGVVLQLFGFVLAAYGLERTLEVFGQTPSTSRIVPWVKGFEDIFDTSGGTVELKAEGVGHAHGLGELTLAHTGPHQTLEEQVERLEEELGRVRDEVRNVRKHVDGEVEGLENKIEEEIEWVEEEVQDVRDKMKRVNIGDQARWIEWCAVFSFVYGVPLASFPSSLLPAYRVLIVPIVTGTLLGSLHWYAD